MSDEATADLVEEAYHLAKCSFVRYIVENSQPETVDDLDRRAFALFEDWSREGRYNQMALGDILEDMSVVPAASSFPLNFSQYNFLRPSYLLKPVIEKSEGELQSLSEIAQALAAEPRARDLVTAVISRQRYYLERARKLEEDRPREEPKPARVKGTSASMW
jgi:hypothetical protein